MIIGKRPLLFLLLFLQQGGCSALVFSALRLCIKKIKQKLKKAVEKMTNIQLKKFEKNLTKYTKSLNELGTADYKARYESLLEIYSKLKSLASDVGASLILGANILNVDAVSGTEYQSQCVRLEAFIGELINNIHCTLQTKMMLNACVLANHSCFWAAVAAIAGCISILLVLFCGM